MSRNPRWIVIALAALALGMAATSNGPISVDWHKGGQLYVLLKSGSISILDPSTKRKQATIPALFGMVPVEVFSARLKDRDFIFVSGFWGRTGSIWQYTADGQPYGRIETPEQAASFDIDPKRRVLYVASPVTSNVYSISLDQKGSAAKRVVYIREAGAVGPVIYDHSRNRLMVGDTGRGVLYDVDVATGSYQQIASDLGRPISLAIDAAFKTLFVADYKNGRIHLLRLENGTFKRGETINTGLRGLSAVGLGPDDTVFVADGESFYQLSLTTKKLSRFAH